VALCLALSLLLPPAAPAEGKLPPPLVSERQAIAAARQDSNGARALRQHPDLDISAERDQGDGDWQVGFYADGAEIVQVVVDDTTGIVLESWTGYQVAWKMARGYPGAFGRKVNAPYVWLPLCAIFVLGLLDWRRLRRIAHLDLLVIVAGFGLSHYFFNRGVIGLSVPLAYPALVYLLARMLWLGFRGGGGLRPSAPATWLAVAALFLTGFKVGLNVANSNVIDVGYAGVIGADRIADGTALYGNFPADNQAGDTYGPLAYYAYVPFEQALPWSGRWDDLPAAHAAAVFFDLATLMGLFLLGRRLRPGEAGAALGATLAFAWAACPYSTYVLESNTNDALVSALLVATLLVLSSAPLRGMMLALATAVKFVPLALLPLFAAYPERPLELDAGSSTGADGDPAPDADREGGGAAGAGGAAATGGAAADRPRTATLPAGWSAAVTGPVARYFATFIVTLLVVSAQFLIDPGLSTLLDRTLGHQLGRDSPFSIWGQDHSLEWLQTILKVAVTGLALLVAFRPRRRDAVTVAALGAAVLIAVQLTVEHWFYLYIPWFLPFLFVALLARPASSRPAP
jgi:hypothetical protein